MNINSLFKRGIQRRLIITCLMLGLIPMLVMGVMSYMGSSQMLVDQTNAQMRSLTAKAIEQLDSQLMINEVANLAQARVLTDLDSAEKMNELVGPIIEDISRSMEPPMTRKLTSLNGSVPIFFRPTLTANSAVVPAI